jgi:acetoin utilization protein AcuB
VTIDTIMTRQLLTVGMDETVETVSRLLAQHHVHHLLVVEHGRLLGVISDRDVLRNLSPFVGRPSERVQDAHLLRRHAHQIMTRHPVCVRPHTPIAEACTLLLFHGVSCLPVLTDDGRPIGIVTWRDLLRHFMPHERSAAA